MNGCLKNTIISQRAYISLTPGIGLVGEPTIGFETLPQYAGALTVSINFTRRLAAAAAIVALPVALAACSPGNTDDPTVRSTRTAPPTAAPSNAAPERQSQSSTGMADRQAARARKALNALAARTPSPSTKQLLSALVEAGFAKNRLEATRSSTPLANDVPSVMYGIKVNKSSCLVGEIREGVATVTVTDPVENGKRCLIGVVDAPDGESS